MLPASEEFGLPDCGGGGGHADPLPGSPADPSALGRAPFPHYQPHLGAALLPGAQSSVAHEEVLALFPRLVPAVLRGDGKGVRQDSAGRGAPLVEAAQHGPGRPRWGEGAHGNDGGPGRARGGPGAAKAGRPMRILIVNTLYPPLQVGGAEKSVSLLAEALGRTGDEVSVVSLHP